MTARHVGFDVIYAGIRLTCEEIAQSALEESADIIGLSVLSGSHVILAEQLMAQLDEAGATEHIPVVLGGIVPAEDVELLQQRGIKRIFTPADYALADVMAQLLDVLEEAHADALS